MAYDASIAEEGAGAFAGSVEYMALALKGPSAANEMMLAFGDFVTRLIQLYSTQNDIDLGRNIQKSPHSSAPAPFDSMTNKRAR